MKPTATQTNLLIERIDSIKLLSTLRDEWDRLFLSTRSHLPFWTFDWVEAWWKYFQRNTFAVRDSPRIYAVRDSTGVLIAVAPMMLTERPAVGLLRARSLGFFGADPNMTELKGVICTADDTERVHLSLLQHFAEHEAEWDWLEWSSVTESCHDLFELRGDVESKRKVTSYLLPLTASSWEEMKRGLNRNIRESLRKCYNSLKRDGHAFEFHVADSPAQVPAALDHLFRLHAARSALSGTTPHLNVFATEHSRRFLREVCERLAAQGHWRAFSLSIAGRVVAIRLGFRFDDALYLYYSGFDPAWGKYSVMTTTVAEALKHAMAAGIKCVNLSTGSDVSKTRWSPLEVTYFDLTLCSPGIRSQLAHRAYRYAVSMRRHTVTAG